MELENQVVSLELAKKLKELGVKQESLFYWCVACTKPHAFFHLTSEESMNSGIGSGRYISAFTVAELINMLPNTIVTEKILEPLQINQYSIWAFNYGRRVVFSAYTGDTFDDALARFVIYLIENKLITPLN
jgi:hypothetical protein